LKWTVIYSVLTLLFLEVFLRILGYRPFNNDDYSVSSKPKYPYIADQKLGIQLREGTFEITLNKAVKFRATHLSNGERFIPGADMPGQPEILFLGCSFTYGYGVDDGDAFPALIQNELTDWRVRNSAVPGYGTAQHLLQLRERIKSDPPEAVFLSLSSVHFIRTVLSHRYRSNLRIGYRRSAQEVNDKMKGAKFPYMETCGEIKFQDWETMYPEIWGRYTTATANFLQIRWDRIKEASADPVEITACIIQEMKQLCEEKNIPFGVICLDSNHETKRLEKSIPEVPWKNVGFSFKNKKLTNHPHDGHPNRAGHKKIAQSVLPFVIKTIENAE